MDRSQFSVNFRSNEKWRIKNSFLKFLIERRRNEREESGNSESFKKEFSFCVVFAYFLHIWWKTFTQVYILRRKADNIVEKKG